MHNGVILSKAKGLKELPPDYFDYLIAEFCGGGTMNVTPPPVRRSVQWC